MKKRSIVTIDTCNPLLPVPTFHRYPHQVSYSQSSLPDYMMEGSITETEWKSREAQWQKSQTAYETELQELKDKNAKLAESYADLRVALDDMAKLVEELAPDSEDSKIADVSM